MNPETESHDILVVDDTPENITLLRDILVRAGHRVRPALRGALALRAVEAQCPDLVLLDIMMPEMDGYETCARLKAIPAARDVPVLFISALDGKDDKVRAFAAGAVDYVSKPFHAEEVLARVQVHLGLRAARRRLALQNARLEADARLRDEVDGLLRHDLKSPLSTILMATETLIDPPEPLAPEARAEIAGCIRDVGWTMLEMIHRSLDLLKMERGLYAVSAIPLDLLACLRQVAAELALSPAGRHARIEFPGVAEGAVWPVRGEVLLCRGLFRNLLKNALEASPSGGVVRLEWDGAGGVALTNAGEVPVVIRDHLFQKFATAGKTGGSGLGGYSARLMAETQGGAVRLEPAPAGWTRIVVRLPHADGVAAGFETSAAGGNGGRVPVATVAAGTGAVFIGRILVADDDSAQAEATTRLLAGPGRQIVRARDGREAIDLLARGEVDAALLDHEMPGASGVEVARRHRAAGGRARLVALTAHDDAAVHAACRAAGFDRILVKPVGRRELEAALTGGAAGEPVGGAMPVAVARGVMADATVEMDPDLAPLVPAFLVAREGEVTALAGALAGRELERSRVLAHRLRGGFAVYGFAGAAEVCRQIEQAAMAGDFTAGAARVATLRATLVELRGCFGAPAV